MSAKPASEAALVAVIARRLSASLLSGDTAFTPGELKQAARFVLSAAASREPGVAALAMETVSGGADTRYMRIAAINDNMPFLVDSMAATIAAHGLAIDRLVHPIMAVRRDAQGRLIALSEDDAADTARESIVYFETSRADARTRIRLAAALEATLRDVRAAVGNWSAMQAAMAADAERLGDTEAAALLRWLKDGMLTQLGHVFRRRDGSKQGALGICRNGGKALLAPASYERAFAWFDKNGPAPLIVKSNLLSNVHRRVPLDLFIVPVVEGEKVTSLSVHAGVWTSTALATPPGEVPRLRAQLATLMAKSGFDPGGHTGKALIHALTTLPHDLLIGFSDTDLERVALTMMSLVDRPRPKLAMVCAPLERHLLAFVWLPRDLHSTAVRQQIEAMLTGAANARLLDWSLQVEGGSLALLRFVLDIRDCGATPDEAALDMLLQTMLRGWPEAVESELAAIVGTSRAAAVAARFSPAFPLTYRSIHSPAEAAMDICRLRSLGDNAETNAPRRDARLYHGEAGASGQLHLKLCQRRGSMALSDAVPALENFGFRVLSELPTLLNGGDLGAIHDFQLALPAGMTTDDLMARAPAIDTALAAVLNAEAEDDPFNRLIAITGIATREAEWLRAWFRYLRQAGMGYGIATVVDALQNAPLVTRGLIDLFMARLNPDFPGDRASAERLASKAVTDGLSHVAAINDDRLLRQYRALVEAMLRTNAFAPAGQEALAFKLDSALVPGLPRPVPWREIFVYSRRVEGIHLRAGPVARGGIRWSDRRDDFRTEVLGLMKAQRVKNAVIVPTGAKGGFYPKHLPDPSQDREGWLTEGRGAYQTFIRTLLSVTDNIVGGKVVHPAGMVIRDGEDPYFVVAADKGTASFSDTANAIAEDYDFWLDDAFASGGSKGYDHKTMGITARGAWLSVQRHFMELGVDVQSQSVRVVGCGDMSGDVFGNGMLLSKTLKLVAAFDHRHIFLDPDPDPAKSWAERARLFALPRSSWDDYDKSLISAGGGVFPRSLKVIPLSKEMRMVLGIEADSADPETLISAILTAPVDLLWFGGIGTYVKASTENNVAVGDPANDGLRVDGGAIRAKVIGEGANLGCTQAGRIEFALVGSSLSGGRINTDFIDNSAGVDCSDKEVNIKIALASAKRARRLSEKARVKLLTGMTDDVASIVLEDNRLQALALSIAEAGGPQAMASQLRLIETLEASGHLDRKTEGLAASDGLTRRAADGHGLTRPELAVLLSSAKLALQEALEQSALPDEPGMEQELLAAFPPAMRTKFRHDILDHRLRREIVATRLVNRMVNRLGLIQPFELAEEESVTLAQVTAAFFASEHLFGMDPVWQAIENAVMPEAARILLFDRAAKALRTHMADALRAGAGTLQPSKLVADLETGVAQLGQTVDTLLAAEAKAQSAGMLALFAAAGAPDAASAMVVRLFDLDGAIGLATLARDSGTSATRFALAFTDLGTRLGLDWAQGTAARMNPSDPWERLLVSGLARDFQQMRLDFLRRAIGQEGDPAMAVASWAEPQAPAIRQFRNLIGRAQTATPVAPAMLAQIASQARGLLAR